MGEGWGWGGGEKPQLIELLQTILLPSLKVSYAVIANSKVSQKKDLLIYLSAPACPGTADRCYAQAGRIKLISRCKRD